MGREYAVDRQPDGIRLKPDSTHETTRHPQVQDSPPIVTGADIDYVGSVGVDQDLLERTDIIPGERVAIWNINNGTRIDTYAISLPRGSGQIVINGAAARHFHPGDKVIIVAFCLTDEAVEPRMIAVDEQNRFVRDLVPNGSPGHSRARAMAKAKAAKRETMKTHRIAVIAGDGIGKEVIPRQ